MGFSQSTSISLKSFLHGPWNDFPCMEKVRNAPSSEQRNTLRTDGLEKLTLHLAPNRKMGARSKLSALWYPEGRCWKNQPQWHDLGSPGRHHLPSSGWHSPESSCSLFPTTETPPLPRPLPAFLGEPSPKREHTQLPQQGESLSSPWDALGSEPPACPLGLVVLDTTWGRGRELLQTQPLSTPFSRLHCKAKGYSAVPWSCKTLGASAWAWSSAAEAPGVCSPLEKGV